MTDFYSQIVAPRLPAGWPEALAPYTPYLDAVTPIVIGAIVLGAALYTYYEAERQITRDPAIPAKLQEFYVKSDPLVRFDLKDESGLDGRIASAQAWLKEVSTWIKENMSVAAVSRFQDTSNVLPMHHSAAVNKKHDSWVNTLNKFRNNLKDLIENEAWDKPKATMKRKRRVRFWNKKMN